ncbi:hypothetical protein BOTBODRAFT_65887 [Botryobasidium botryosum FD-172 SS1]|uniref:Uncharacterized protein n=1 Tax=Botryobasidium botryosum (strain FD-172 SS1) TaxID=930990 RepID=A0A067MJQ3_BOTB1|nr:hypothetical protein BOTBODRAFT_65887 [Botryobasidium botryosum FD-172 SS1]
MEAQFNAGVPQKFEEECDRLASWLSDSRAYYTAARPQIVFLLEAAINRLAQWQVTPSSERPPIRELQSAEQGVKRVLVVIHQNLGQFKEDELRARLERMIVALGVARGVLYPIQGPPGGPHPHPHGNVPPPSQYQLRPVLAHPQSGTGPHHRYHGATAESLAAPLPYPPPAVSLPHPSHRPTQAHSIQARLRHTLVELTPSVDTRPLPPPSSNPPAPAPTPSASSMTLDMLYALDDEDESDGESVAPGPTSIPQQKPESTAPDLSYIPAPTSTTPAADMADSTDRLPPNGVDAKLPRITPPLNSTPVREGPAASSPTVADATAPAALDPKAAGSLTIHEPTDDTQSGVERQSTPVPAAQPAIAPPSNEGNEGHGATVPDTITAETSTDVQLSEHDSRQHHEGHTSQLADSILDSGAPSLNSGSRSTLPALSQQASDDDIPAASSIAPCDPSATLSSPLAAIHDHGSSPRKREGTKGSIDLGTLGSRSGSPVSTHVHDHSNGGASGPVPPGTGTPQPANADATNGVADDTESEPIPTPPFSNGVSEGTQENDHPSNVLGLQRSNIANEAANTPLHVIRQSSDQAEDMMTEEEPQPPMHADLDHDATPSAPEAPSAVAETCSDPDVHMADGVPDSGIDGAPSEIDTGVQFSTEALEATATQTTPKDTEMRSSVEALPSVDLDDAGEGNIVNTPQATNDDAGSAHNEDPTASSDPIVSHPIPSASPQPRPSASVEIALKSPLRHILLPILRECAGRLFTEAECANKLNGHIPDEHLLKIALNAPAIVKQLQTKIKEIPGLLALLQGQKRRRGDGGEEREQSAQDMPKRQKTNELSSPAEVDAILQAAGVATPEPETMAPDVAPDVAAGSPSAKVAEPQPSGLKLCVEVGDDERPAEMSNPQDSVEPHLPLPRPSTIEPSRDNSPPVEASQNVAPSRGSVLPPGTKPADVAEGQQEEAESPALVARPPVASGVVIEEGQNTLDQDRQTELPLDMDLDNFDDSENVQPLASTAPPADQDVEMSDITVDGSTIVGSATASPTRESVPAAPRSSLPPPTNDSHHHALNGRTSTSVLELTFDVDEAAFRSAQRWGQRFHRFSATEEHMCFELYCLPTATYSALEKDAFADASQKFKNAWPASGNTLWASLNAEEPNFAMHRMLAPPHTPCDEPVCVSAHIKPGANMLTIVHFGSYSDKTFVLRRYAPDAAMKEEALQYQRPQQVFDLWQAALERLRDFPLGESPTLHPGVSVN